MTSWRPLFALDPAAWLVCRLCGEPVGADHEDHADAHRTDPEVEIRASEGALGGFEWRDLRAGRTRRERPARRAVPSSEGPVLVRSDRPRGTVH